jgi:uncharacterized protein (TIGR02270 family)
LAIIEDIVSQHAEEAAFLWLLRSYAVRAPHYDLKDLADLEERVEAHLDGLRVAGEAAWTFCAEGLKQQEVGEVFAGGYFALDAGRDDWLEPVIEVAAETPETLPGLVSALGWVERDRLKGRVADWLQSTEPFLRQLGLAACRVQGVDCGRYLDSGLSDADAGVRAVALRSAGEIRRSGLVPLVLNCLDDDDRACRFQAARAATLFAERRGREGMMEFAGSDPIFGQYAMQVLLRSLEHHDAIDWVRQLNRRDDSARAVIQATGIIGDPSSIPWLIEQMGEPALARVAGEAVSMITGVDLAYDDLETDWPEGFEAGPSEEPEDEDAAMDEDEDLPWPDPALLAQWWVDRRADYRAGVRYLCGEPVSRDQALAVLAGGQQRQRRAAALELALASPADPLFNTSAPARQQRRQLGLR